MLNTVLFDLDGTLLPLDQDVFIEKYFSMLAMTMAPKGFDPKMVIKGVMYGTGAMLKNDGGATNCERFWKAFSEFFGKDMSGYEPDFDQFYRTAFHQVKLAEFSLEPYAVRLLPPVKCRMDDSPLVRYVRRMQ